MRVYSTSDISLQELHAAGNELGPEFQIEVDESQMFYKGAFPLPGSCFSQTLIG